jgi:hypothetical protein
MPSLPHTESRHDHIIPVSFLLRPFISACSSQFSQENRGNDGSQRGNGPIPTNSGSQYHPTATNVAYPQQSVPASSGYRQETMRDYHQERPGPSQAWPTNASSWSPAPSNPPSRPKPSGQRASQGRYQPYQGGRGRSGLGDNGLSGAPLAPDMSYGDREGGREGEGEGEVEREGTSCCDDILSFLDGVGTVLEDIGSNIGSCFKDCCCDKEGHIDIPCPSCD